MKGIGTSPKAILTPYRGCLITIQTGAIIVGPLLSSVEEVAEEQQE